MALAFTDYRGLFVGGGWLDVSAAEDVIDPSTEQVIAQAPVGDLTVLAQAIAAARHAFDRGPWPRMAARERAEILQRFLDALRRHKPDIVELIIAEIGATIATANGLQFDTPMAHAQHAVDHCTRDAIVPMPPLLTPMPDGRTWLGGGVIVREPVGVVAAITPYNAPFFLNIGKVVPAMAMGCTVVLKPSPYTPFEALLLGTIAQQVGLPDGVLNIVTGGIDVSERLTTDPGIDLVTFTGSDTVGARIQAQAAPTLKRVLLELGGKSAMIVRGDADLAAATTAGLRGFTSNAGQGCALHTRHIVHNSVRARYVELLAERARAVTVGDPRDPRTFMGPLIRESQRKRTEDYVALAQADGGRLVAGGHRPDHLDRGFFFEPTLFDDIRNDSRIAQEEVFGPVAVVIGYDDDDEAIAWANESDFGLSGGVFSADVGKAYAIALRIRTGTVSINGGQGAMSSHAPFGGLKRSGYGREYGVEGLNEYTYVKTINYHAA